MDSFYEKLLAPDVIKTYYTPEYTTVHFAKPVTNKYKVSIVTTCMGRAEDVKTTFIKNIKDNLDYWPHLEFLLLNYGSKDDLDTWALNNLVPYIREGIVNYYRTDEPQKYSMAHSRNVAFKLAAGDIVNSVDADHFTNVGFAARINEIANQFKTTEVVFVKSHQRNRGRLGMFKKNFIALGGYDESITDYGSEDMDLVLRAYHSGFNVVKFGGTYCTVTEDHQRHPTENYVEKDWKYTQRRNLLISVLGIMMQRYEANRDRLWGKAHLIKNFSTEIVI